VGRAPLNSSAHTHSLPVPASRCVFSVGTCIGCDAGAVPTAVPLLQQACYCPGYHSLHPTPAAASCLRARPTRHLGDNCTRCVGLSLSHTVIPSKFFSDAHRESQNVPAPDPQMLDSHLFTPSAAVVGKDGKRGCTIVPETHWRRRLISPLVGFLTDVKNKAEWIQLAGHVGSFLPGRGGVICKKVGDREKQCYERLMDEQEPLRDFVPLYFKEVELLEGEWYLELEDLLANFANPNVMDVKMGVRTFLETEVTKKTLRMDLLEKMMALDANEPTKHEKKVGITKLRYMEFREVKSSSRNLGFRIEGIKRSNEKPATDFKKVHSTDEAASAIETFLPEKGSPLRAVVLTAFMERLEDLREALDRSNFFSVSPGLTSRSGPDPISTGCF